MPGPESPKSDALRGPINGKDRPDQVPARDGPPFPAVAGLRAIVAHHEVLACGHVEREVAPAASLLLDVRLLQPLPVHAHNAVSLFEVVTGEPDEPLDEGLAGAAALEAARRGRR